MEQSPTSRSRNNGHYAIQKTIQNRSVSKGVTRLLGLDLYLLSLFLLVC